MSRREKSKLTESGGGVRLQQATYFTGILCWLIFVVGLYLISDRNDKPGLGPTFIMISLGPLVMGFFVAGCSWIFSGGRQHLFYRGTVCVSLALLIIYPVVMFMDDIAGASPGWIATVLMTAACVGFLLAWVTNKSGNRIPPRQ